MAKVQASLTKLVVVLLGLMIQTNASAQGDAEVQECAAAYEKAQMSRNEGLLREAQEQLRICVREVCPEFVRVDCGQWLSDVKREIPSVIFSVVNTQGQELSQFTVTMDGAPIEVASGKAVEVDPGQHEFVVTHAGKSTKQQVIIRQGEKNRVLVVKIQTDLDSDDDGVTDDLDDCPGEPGVADNAGCPEVMPPPIIPPETSGGVPVASFVSWGVGVAGLATFGIFAALGDAEEQDTLEECLDEMGRNTCPDSQARIDSVDQKFLIANIGLGVGIAGAAVGTVLLFTLDNGDSDQAAGLNVSPLGEGGGFVSYRGSF